MRSDEVRPGAAESVLTPELLETFWPVARARLVERLKSRGADTATAEDAAAEAATRALARRVPVTDVEDFCRWAYVVARNVATDSARHRKRLELVEAVPDYADGYDLAHHVEVREQWRKTSAAIDGLATRDRAVLLAVLEPERRQMTRKESVHEAIRRHRARARLQRALRHVGGWLGWLRSPLWPWRAGRSPWSEALAVLLPPLVALTSGGAVPVDPFVPSLPALAWTDAGPPSAQAMSSSPPARPTITPTNADHGSPTGPPVSNATATDDPASYTVNGFAASPSYDEDGTVFATGGERACNRPVGGCPVLLRSDDRGVTWTRLPAVGRDAGSILLPPAYPRDPRIFSASAATFSVSSDGGQTFRPLFTATGPASMSPLFSDGDPRVLFGTDPILTTPTARQYVDGEPTLRPLYLPLPVDVLPVGFRFSAGYSHDGRILVTTVDAPKVVDTATLSFRPSMHETAVFGCDAASCRRVVGLGQVNGNVAWVSTAQDAVVLIAGPRSLYRSTDGGRTFAELAVPDGRSRTRSALVATPEGRVLLSVEPFGKGASRLYASDDNGSSWELVAEASDSFERLAVLPDGALLEGRLDAVGGIRCSVDGGRTWARACERR